MTDNTGARDAVKIERSFDAPVDFIWQMWTDPKHFAAWYGPDGATIPVAKMDVHVGGTRLVCMEMQTPNGPMQMWFTGEYREVVENERLVYTESMSDENGNVVLPSDLGIPAGHPSTTQVRVELVVLPEMPHAFMLYSCGITKSWAETTAAWFEARLAT